MKKKLLLIGIVVGMLSVVAYADNKYAGIEDVEGIEMRCHDLNTGDISTAYFANTPLSEMDPSKITEHDGVIEIIEPAIYSKSDLNAGNGGGLKSLTPVSDASYFSMVPLSVYKKWGVS